MSLQDRLETIRSAPAPQNEESAKLQILAPILQNLGWDPFGSETLYEHPVGGKGGGRVDIALRGPDRIVALIEAKTPGSNLNSHVGQVLSYAFHEGVDICVLTTGLEWWLYLPRESGPPSERRFAVLKVRKDPVEQLVDDFGAFLGKDTLVSGQAERQAKLVLKARIEAAQLNKEIPSIWKGMLTAPDDELVDLLSKRVYEKVSLRPTKPQVVAALQGSPIPSATVPAAPPDAPSPPTMQEKRAKRKTPRYSAKPTAMVLWDDRYPVSTHAEGLRKFLDLLYDRHRDDFDRVLQLRGRKYPFASRDPQMLSKEGQTSYYEPKSSGYFFDIWLNASGIKRRAGEFLECFGYSVSDFKFLYDQDPAE